MRRTAVLMAALGSMCFFGTPARAAVIIYNQAQTPTPNTGNMANFGAHGLTLTLTDPAFTTVFTGGDAPPLSSYPAVQLNSIGFLQGDGANGPPIDDNVNHYLKVFSGAPSAATFVGVSTNFQSFDDDVATAQLRTFTFAGLPLSTSANHLFAFASNGAADATGLNLLGRVQGSNEAGDMYASGTFVGSNYTSAADGTLKDPVFVISAAVPEPAAAVPLLALTVPTLLRRRRGRNR